MIKVCTSCGISKTSINFYADATICKPCKNKRREEFKKNDSNPQLQKLIEYHQKAHLVLLEPGSTHEKMIKYIEMLDFMKQKSLNIVDETIIELKIKIPDNLHNYLCHIKKEGEMNLRIAKMYLRDNDNEAEFEKHFDMRHSDLKKYIDLIDDLDHITGFVRYAYQLLVDDVITRRLSIFSKSWLDQDRSDVELRSNPDIQFDPDTDRIIIKNNPLCIDQMAFLCAVENLINKKDNSLMMYVHMGFYDKFKNLLIY